MYIHLGNNTVIKTKEIVGIFDLDNTTVSARTRKFLNKAEKNKNVIVTSNELPKSFVVTSKKRGENKIYLSQLSTLTLCKRKMIYKNI
ncbi:MAG: DUF370 domain-containing protein [Clostridia bacterium]|nr:DUF370 domain-containing protein [Clostridia bacterium]